MRQGCISLGEIQCNECHHTIPHSNRYLLMEEAKGTKLRLCVDCCLRKGYAGYKEEKKGEKVLTFFTEESINQ